jgi:enoyl-CoA hydratase/carnithine racemase
VITAERHPFAQAERTRAQDAAAGAWRNIHVERDGAGRATVTICRPKRLNCFDYLTLLELAAAFHELGRDSEVHVVVLTGEGERAFCTGADLVEQRDVLVANPQHYHTWMGAFIDVHDRLRNIGKPTIARINGICVGGGNEFQMACDLSVIADHGYIRHVGPYHGSVPLGGATQWLQLMVGDRRAREILWLCEEVPAATAAEWGLVNKAVPAAELDHVVDAWAARLLQALPETLRYTRTQTNFWKDLAWYQTIHHGRDWLTLHTNAPEVHEAIRAFTDKRPLEHERLHAAYGTPAGAYGRWGAPTATCPSCGAVDLPYSFSHCGNCGTELPRD